MKKRKSRLVMVSQRLGCRVTGMPVLTPMIVPKRESMVEGIEEVIISLYGKGMSVSEIEEQIKDVYKFELSTATISRITSRVVEDIVAWQNRPFGARLLTV